MQEKRGFPPTEGVTLSGVRPTGLGRGLYVDVTLEKLDERVPKVQCGTGSAPVNLSGKRTETKKAPLLCPMGPAGGCFFRNVFGPWSVLHGLFFVQKRRGIHHVRVFGSGTVPHCSQHQYLFVQLYSGLSAHRRGPVLQHPHPLCAGALLRRGDAEGVRQPDPPGREAGARDELLPGPGHRHCRPGGHRQHRGRIGRDPGRRPRRHLLDVGHRLLWHGDHLCGGYPGH